MKNLLLTCLLLGLVSCASKTEFGPCVGIADDKNPNLEYKLSVRNAVIGVVFFELILPPIFVLVDETFCPVGPKGDKNGTK